MSLRLKLARMLYPCCWINMTGTYCAGLCEVSLESLLSFIYQAIVINETFVIIIYARFIYQVISWVISHLGYNYRSADALRLICSCTFKITVFLIKLS